jgi:hypothetical protein
LFSTLSYLLPLAKNFFASVVALPDDEVPFSNDCAVIGETTFFLAISLKIPLDVIASLIGCAAYCDSAEYFESVSLSAFSLVLSLYR